MIKGVDYPGISIVYFCHDGKGNFVMHKRGKNCRDEHGRWDIGGGGLKLHDSVEDTLKREIMEEYCANVLEFEFLGYRDVHRQHAGESTHWIALDFKVLVYTEQVKNGEPHKFEEIKWFTLDKLPKKMHSELNNFFNKYINKFLNQ